MKKLNKVKLKKVLDKIEIELRPPYKNINGGVAEAKIYAYDDKEYTEQIKIKHDTINR